MLEQILDHLHNYFIANNGVHYGDFEISNGSVDLDFLQTGQYFKIVGSIFNDGVYQYPASNLVDETFSGEIWALAIPSAVINIAQEIEEWTIKYPATGYISESFGNYSYSMRTSFRGSAVAGWEDVFRGRLNHWRKP